MLWVLIIIDGCVHRCRQVNRFRTRIERVTDAESQIKRRTYNEINYDRCFDISVLTVYVGLIPFRGPQLDYSTLM